MSPSINFVGLFLPLSKLSRWMSALYHPLERGHRQQIKLRAASQKREMTIHTIQKGTNKKQVSFGKPKVVTDHAIFKWLFVTGIVVSLLAPFSLCSPPLCEAAMPRTGGKDLSKSAAYPRDFGREIARLHVDSMATYLNIQILESERLKLKDCLTS